MHKSWIVHKDRYLIIFYGKIKIKSDLTMKQSWNMHICTWCLDKKSHIDLPAKSYVSTQI